MVCDLREGEGKGFEPLAVFSKCTELSVRRLRPLGHPSAHCEVLGPETDQRR